jgi:hypothetical protein
METLETSKFTADKREGLNQELNQNSEEKFIPKGAIAFFFLLVLLGLAIWYGIYFLMLERI